MSITTALSKERRGKEIISYEKQFKEDFLVINICNVIIDLSATLL